MNKHLSNIQIIIISIAAAIIILTSSFFLGRNDNNLASIASGSCSLQSEIDQKISNKADLEADLVALDGTKVSLEAEISKVELDLSSMTLAIPKAENEILSDYAISLEKAKVDLLYAKYTAEKDIAAKLLALKRTKPKTAAYKTAQAKYTAAVAAYKAKFKSNPGNYPMTERSHRELQTKYDVLIQKNAAAKEKLKALQDSKVSLEALAVSLPQKIADTDKDITKLKSDILDLTTALKSAALCAPTETICDDKATDGAEIDNDRDGVANCSDSDCSVSPACQKDSVIVEPAPSEPCSTLDARYYQPIGGRADYYNSCEIEAFEAGNVQNIGITGTNIGIGTGEVCDNGMDDEEDGFADCADSECSTTKECTGEQDPEVCFDGVDNNEDGRVDEDCTEDCAATGTCEVCGDNIDNNNNGQTDEDCASCGDPKACNYDQEAKAGSKAGCYYRAEYQNTGVQTSHADERKGFLASIYESFGRFVAQEENEGWSVFLTYSFTFSSDAVAEGTYDLSMIGFVRGVPITLPLVSGSAPSFTSGLKEAKGILVEKARSIVGLTNTDVVDLTNEVLNASLSPACRKGE